MSTPALKGPAWVTIRQYQRTLWAAAALAVLALAVVAGLRILTAQHPVPPAQDGVWIGSPDDQWYSTLRWILEYVGIAAIVLPGVAAVLVAGPMVAREYESGTYQLSLTQSVSPTAWLRSKLGVATTFALLATLAVMGVFWLGRLGVREGWDYRWGDPWAYATTGITSFAYVIAAVAVGGLVGQLVRRTLLAMAASGLIMAVVLIGFTSYRWSILPTERLTGPIDSPPRLPRENMFMDSGLLTSSGAPFDQAICWEEAQRTPGVDSQEGLWAEAEAQCHAKYDVTAQYIDYHPYAHYWPTQLIETGILLALAALAALAAFRVLRARHP
ncbi:ABC transporter permease [Streptomyces griseus]|uniref:ABC transporter permease n=1 Tax=Streptomyces griseus TaxID=1911 RepID=UPI0004C9AB3F|nr:ABC transporter permease [Streptomyces griseus]